MPYLTINISLERMYLYEWKYSKPSMIVFIDVLLFCFALFYENRYSSMWILSVNKISIYIFTLCWTLYNFYLLLVSGIPAITISVN